MEEIYIIRLKGLPSSSQESLRDNKASFYYRKDLTGEALLGFGTLHSFVGSTLIVLSIINLLLHDNKSQILGAGVWCGSIFAVAGLMGIITAQKRKTDISKSKIQVKIFFTLSIVTFMLTSTYLMLTIFDMKEPTANHYIETNILLSFVFELFTSSLSLFTCIRIIWPGSISCCAKDWPMQPKLKRKVIVSTQIYTNGVKQDEDLIRNLGPNCVISLSPPQTTAITKSHINNYSLTNDLNQTISMCECCQQDFNNSSDHDMNSTQSHNKFSHNSSEDLNREQYDSDFDSIVEQEIHENHDSLPEEHGMEVVIEENSNEMNYNNESKYETIGQNDNSSQTSCLNINSNDDNCIHKEDSIDEEFNESYSIKCKQFLDDV